MRYAFKILLVRDVDGIKTWHGALLYRYTSIDIYVALFLC